MRRQLVLLSGGQDSATCLAIALAKPNSSIQTIVFDYGQRHAIEIDCARKLAQLANVPIKVIDASFLSQFNDNALVDSTKKVEVLSSKYPSTFVPGRNLLFLSFAGILSYQWQCQEIVTGVCQTDFSGYPDCRLEFIQTFNAALNLSLESPINISTPLMWLTKSETVLLMHRLGRLDWYSETHTCYEGKRPACGKCPSCLLRLNGFREAGIRDPLNYE